MVKEESGEIVTVMYLKNTIATVHQPILAEEERARRMKIINDAAVALLMQTIRAQREREGKTA